MNFVTPQVFLIGYTAVDDVALAKYLRAVGCESFLDEFYAARDQGITGGEALCSFYAKLCYKSLAVGANLNISRTRGIKENIEGCFDVGHGSVFEHCFLNFVITGCSRVFSHELVRHRVGTAFSQTSGRYVRTDSIDFVHDPILDECKDIEASALALLQNHYDMMSVRMGIADVAIAKELLMNGGHEQMSEADYSLLANYREPTVKDFETKKRITSALRRILPNGQSNEIGFSVNIRELRHIVVMRTSRHAEWEMRKVFGDVFEIVRAKFPMIFYGLLRTEVNGLVEITQC